MRKTEYLSRIRHGLFFLFLALICITYFPKDGYKSIDQVVNGALQSPIQTPAKNQNPIIFDKDGYSYVLTPTHDYTLAGLVLHARKYDKWYSLSRTDKTFVKDICVIWGKTLQNKGYQSADIRQDSRWCWWGTLKQGQVINSDEFSNNHLISNNPSVEKQILSIGGGDQVRIVGKLVNVHASVMGEADDYEYQQADWRTSTNRNDSGAGACEIIYVEKIEIIRRGHPILRFLFSFGWYGLASVILWSLIGFLYDLQLSKRKNVPTGDENRT